jgi:hypothetical protein
VTSWDEGIFFKGGIMRQIDEGVVERAGQKKKTGRDEDRRGMTRASDRSGRDDYLRAQLRACPPL